MKKVLFLSLLLIPLTQCRSFQSFDTRTEDESSSTKEGAQNPKSDPENQASVAEESLAKLYIVHAFETDDSKVFTGKLTADDLKSAAKIIEPDVKLLADPTADDMRRSRLDLMIDIILKLADKDTSGNLSLDEFVVFRLKVLKLSKAAEDRINAWRKQVFALAAGEDDILSKDELRILLKAHRKYVNKVRGVAGGLLNSLISLAKTLWTTSIARYDTNRDGNIDSTERDKLEHDGHKLFTWAFTFIDKRCVKEERFEMQECRIYQDVKKFCEKRDEVFIEVLCGELDFWISVIKGDPSPSPSASASPSASPSPSESPSASPSASPSESPSASPSASPSESPSASPTSTP